MKHIPLGDFSDKKTLEKYSSAFTLSDMEIFIFPELFYPLVLANILSPVIWSWRDDPWFANIEKKGFTFKANRIKQFIIDNYVFNLDLSTWGLTTKGKEIDRFSSYFDIEMLRQSNALFGYEGDKYYFDIDIRKHFGLDKFNTDVIPYWKTETVEAMTAFRHKENFTTGAGECVSLSALYAASMFVIGRVPLEKIFLIATPLHSQNFITEKEGLITNNRRIVTKNMWFNGTSLSAKARRAIENEKITIVSHISGFIHTLYETATIDRNSYEFFSGELRKFLVTDLTRQIFINFLRFKSRYKNLFQYKCDCGGYNRYILLEKMFEYEHGSKFSVAEETREQLVMEIEGDEFHLSPISGKILLNDIEVLLRESEGQPLDVIESKFIERSGYNDKQMIADMFMEIRDFIRTEPRLPDQEKNYIPAVFPVISTDDSREAIVSKIKSMSSVSELCSLTLYAYRQMDVIDWSPFIKASIERNPVCFTELGNTSPAQLYDLLNQMPDESIYDSVRLALPDEVWNFKRGDGLEKAILLANYIHLQDNTATIEIVAAAGHVEVKSKGSKFIFTSVKGFKKKISITGANYTIE